MSESPSPRTSSAAPARRPARSWLLGLAGVAVAGAAWFALAQSPSLGGPGECRAAAATADRMRPLATGEVAAVTINAPRPAPDVAFTNPQGQPADLASLRGKTILVNLWATWCVPCRQEMPALDKLQAELGGPDFEVVALNVDTRNAERPKAWLQENGIRHLAYYADPTGKALQLLQKSGHVVGLPTTLLVDASGCEIGLLKGPAEWDSADAIRLVRAALGRS